jgi:putative DNA primase/helicase
MSAIPAFREAMRQRGLIPPAEIKADGNIHRCDVEGDHGVGDGAYLLHDDDHPAGGFQNWRDGLEWQTWAACSSTSWTAAERIAFNKKVAADKELARLEAADRRIQAAIKAVRLWGEAAPAADHPYLMLKKVGAYGVRVFKGLLVVPIRNDEGNIWSLQFISADGRDKRYLSGGEIKGRHFIIGEPGSVICVGEGFATMATVHEVTGHACVVAFHCGNLKVVAEAMRRKFPTAMILLCADDDHLTTGNPGREKARAAAAAVGGRVVLPEFDASRPDNATDFNDMAAISGPDAVRSCVERALAAPIRQGDEAPEGLRILSAAELLDLTLPPREMILEPILPAQGLVMLFGTRGLGKTHVALGIAHAVATGGQFLKWKASKPRRVLFIDGEMPGAAMQERVRCLVAGAGPISEPGALRFLLADIQGTAVLPDLGSEEGQAALERLWGPMPPDLLIIDNLSSLVSSTRDNDVESWSVMQTWLLRLRRMGVAVLLVHHAGKGGQQRGTSRKEDVLDTSIALRRPPDYEPRQGARFEVHLEKARGVVGEDAEPFEAALVTDDHGRQTWTWQPLEDADYARAKALFVDGISVRDAVAELGMSKSTVGRHYKRAKAEGFVPTRTDD